MNFLNTLIGLITGHKLNPACAFVFPCKGMRNETCTVPDMGTEMRTVRWFFMDDTREQATHVGAEEMVALCALASSMA